MNIKQNGVEGLPVGSQITAEVSLKDFNPKTKRIKSFLWRYGLALGLCLLTVLISGILTAYSIKLNLTILIIVALIIPAWYGGRGPGLMVAVIFEVITILSRPIPPPDTSIGQYIFGHFSILSLMVFLVLLVSSRRNIEERLRESEQRYRHLFENNPFPMWVYNLETLKFLAVNDAAISHYGYSRKDFLAMTIEDLRPTEEIPAVSDELAKPDAKINWKHRKKDGSLIDVEITWHELIFDGKRSRLVLANDVTERNRAEEAIRQLNETLELRVAERTIELEASNKDLEAFSYSVSHDLRAPLRAIDGFANIFIEDYLDKLDNEAKDVIEVIRRNTKNMGQLIDDLLEFSRLGRKHIEPTAIDMTQLAQEVCSQIEPDLSKTTTIKIEKLPDLEGDRGLLRQVFVNLVANAVKYSRIKETPLIDIGGKIEAQENIYYIRDNGAGFDMKYANKLFSVFQRLHSAQEFEGSGVGLAIVQRVIQRHGGRVWAEGEINKGATFYFALPLNHPRQN